MGVLAIQTGRLTANETLWRSGSLSSLLRRKEEITFPATFFVLERSEGLVAVDSGIDSRAKTPRALQRIVPAPSAGPQDEAGPRMASAGLEAAEIGTVLATHLDWDHIGGVRHFPNATVHVHREDHKWATGFRAKGRTLPKLWPESFQPRLFELESAPYGPFARSAGVPGLEGIRIVPLPGHTPGQVGFVVDDGNRRLFFCGDHMLRVDWFEENFASGRKRALLEFSGKAGTDTSERVHTLAEESDVVMIPSHDPDAHRAAGFTVI